jgi:protein-S-isoprenylcysteine O-methyltransferase Ste14
MTGPLITLLAIFAYGALHSLMASPWVKRHVCQAIGPASDKFYRLFYNVVGGITFLPVLAVVAIHPGSPIYRIPWPWSLLSMFGQIGAILLLAIGLLHTDIWQFLGLRQLIQPNRESAPTLVVSGLYRWVRHPLYTAGLIFIWLTPVMTTSILALNIGLTLYIYIGSLFEERRLLAEYGHAYFEYQRAVPRLIPILWRKSNDP